MKINACTFASDVQFHFVRVSIYSFIQNNQWFDGTVYLLVHPDFPISNANLAKLQMIYSNIEIVQILQNSKLLIDYKNSGNPNFINEISDYCKLYFLSLEIPNLLYFSNSSLITNSLDPFLIPEKLTISPEKSIIYSGSSTQIFQEFLTLSLDPNSFLDSKLEIGNLISIENLTIDASEIRDNRFNQYKEKINFASSIFYNPKLVASSSPIHRKVLQIWLHKNNTISQWLSSPRNISFPNKNYHSHISVKSKILNQSVANSNRVFESSLKLNSGDLLANKKISLCTICNDSFLPGAQTLIYSFLKNNPWFNHDIIVFYNPTYSPLSKSSKASLVVIYPKIIFKKVNTGDYSNLIKKFKSSSSNKARFIPSLFTFEAFELTKDYEKVLYLDSDMLVLSDLSELFSLPYEIAVTPDAGKYDLSANYSTFNGGFLMLDQSIHDKNYKNDLIAFAITSNNMKLADQSIMNDFLKSDVKYLNSKYNCLKRCFPDEKFHLFDKNIKIIHYVGAKPWSQKKEPFELKYSKLEKMWNNYYSNLIK